MGYLGLALANRLLPKMASKVVLHSTIDLEDGILAVIDELSSRGWRPYVLLEDPRKGKQLRALAAGQVRSIPKSSPRALVHYLTARYVMTTEKVYGDRQPPSSQIVVNIWHGEPPTKVTGRFFQGQRGMECTYAPVCSTVGRAYRAAEFDLHPLRVPIVGAPRNDRMLRADRDAARQALLAADADRPTFFWLPSFRTGQWGSRQRSDVAVHHPGVPFAADQVRRLDDWLTARGARIVVKLHPHDVASLTGEFTAIRVLAQEEMQATGLTLYTLLPAFDGLITDMSSVWVDYLLMDRPMVFAFPDVANYRDGRGLNLEPFEDWVPGPFARTMDELIAALDEILAGHDPMADERRRARRRFHQYADDRSTERLLDGLGISARPDGPAGTADVSTPRDGFRTVGGAGVAPVPPSWRKRLPYAALAVINRLVPKVDSRVVVHSPVDIEDGVLAVMAESAARGLDVTVLLEDRARGPLMRRLTPNRVRMVPKWSARGLFTYLTARYVVTTSNILGNRTPPKSQVVVSLWHGEPPTKVTGRFEGQGGIGCTYALVCSTVGRAYRATEFDVHPLRVPIVGAPRNDRMLGADRDAVRRTLLGEDADRTTFVWMPSFRSGQWGGRQRSDAAARNPGVPFSEDLQRLDDWLVTRGARIVVKLHPRDAATFSGTYRAIRVLRQGDLEQLGLTLYPALSAFDALITDMSSVWVDYLLMNRPMIFAFPDVDDYRHGRGLNLEPYEDWVPGPFARTIDELIAALDDILAGRDPMADERGRARRRFHQYADDRSTQRLLDGLGIKAR